MLIEHRVDNMNERLIAVDKTMPPTKNVALQPTFHGVLAKHFHDSAIRRQLPPVGVFRKILAHPDLFTDFIQGLELIGLSLVRPEHSESLDVVSHYFPKEIAERRDVASERCAGLLDFDREVTKIREHKG